jgi:hypothetical protein
MKYWTVHSGGHEWSQGDVELQVRGNTGTFAFTCTSVSPNQPAELRAKMVGSKSVWTFDNWKDDGKTVTFSFSTGGQVLTFQLTRQSDGRLTGRMHAPEAKRKEPGMEVISPELEGTLDLVPAPR